MDSKCVIAAKDSGDLSGCIRIYSIPPVDQSVLRKVGFELSCRRRRGDVMILSLYSSNNSISGGNHASIGKI